MILIPENHTVADSVELIVGTSASSVSDIQVQYDGNQYDLAEVAATPGIDLRINFKNVIRFSGIGYEAYYSGSATHWVEFQLWNYLTGEFETYATIENSNGMNYRFFDTQDFVEHVNNKGEVIARFYHPVSGNNSHDLYIDYVALIR